MSERERERERPLARFDRSLLMFHSRQKKFRRSGREREPLDRIRITGGADVKAQRKERALFHLLFN